MPEKTSTSSPSSPRRSCDADGRGTAPRLLCPPELPGVSLALVHRSTAAQARHAHESLTLGLVTAGVRRLEAGGARTLVRTGECYLLPPGLAHGCAPEHGPCSALVLSIAPEMLPEPLRRAFSAPLAAASALRLGDPELAQAILHLAEACETSAGELERQSLLACVLERLGAHVPQKRSEAAQAATTRPMEAAVRRAVEILDAEADEGVDLPALAEACGVEMYALHRAFTHSMGLPPHTYQTHLRLRRAKALLRGGASLTDAALEAGFCDQSHMHRHFTRLVGFTPAQYACAHRARRAGGSGNSGGPGDGPRPSEGPGEEPED